MSVENAVATAVVRSGRHGASGGAASGAGSDPIAAIVRWMASTTSSETRSAAAPVEKIGAGLGHLGERPTEKLLVDLAGRPDELECVSDLAADDDVGDRWDRTAAIRSGRVTAQHLAAAEAAAARWSFRVSRAGGARRPRI